LKTGKIGPGRLSKVAGTALPAFQKRIVKLEKYLGISKWLSWLWPAFKKLSAQLQKICYPIQMAL
jgi:hypothetical protein